MSHKTCIKLLNVVNSHFPDATPLCVNERIEGDFSRFSGVLMRIYRAIAERLYAAARCLKRYCFR